MSRELPIDPSLADLDAAAARRGTPSTFVGICVADRHPTLLGRVRVQWRDEGSSFERWVPTLMNLPVREGDHVLLSTPANWYEPIVVGVIDGFAERPAVSRTQAATVQMKADETIAVLDARDRPLFEVHADEQGVPTLTIQNPSLSLEVEGKLSLAASSVELRSSSGDIDVEAKGDVTVQGRTINLN